jgi:hypothetical protein
MTPPSDLTLPTPAALLVLGIGFLSGFALGLAVEYVNLRIRERQLARDRHFARLPPHRTDARHVPRRRQGNKDT